VATHLVVSCLSLKFALLREQKRLLLVFVLDFFFFFSWRGDKCVGLCICVCVCFLAEGCQLVGCGCERERERRALGSRRGETFVVHPKASKLWVFV
jgi:hypothetical protein